MHLTCPSCHDRYPLAAGFLEDDGKRLAALLANMEPVLGRAVVGYLRLFKPVKQGLRTARAVKLVQALDDLVRAGSVCKDERGGVRRPASPATWAEGIEQMLVDQARLSLPLANHNYLRTVVYGIADRADAAAERQREEDLRQGRRPESASADPDAERKAALVEDLRRIDSDLDLGLLEPEEAEDKRRAAKQRYRSQS